MYMYMYIQHVVSYCIIHVYIIDMYITSCEFVNINKPFQYCVTDTTAKHHAKTYMYNTCATCTLYIHVGIGICAGMVFC
jgi:hypothetical protein